MKEMTNQNAKGMKALVIRISQDTETKDKHNGELGIEKKEFLNSGKSSIQVKCSSDYTIK